MELFIGICFALMMGFLIGYSTHEQRSVDYKKRWREALALLDVSEEQIPAIEEGGTPKKGPKAVPLDLTTVVWWARAEIEKARLKEGMPPRDPLTKLPGHCVRDIEEARAKAGWFVNDEGNWERT